MVHILQGQRKPQQQMKADTFTVIT